MVCSYKRTKNIIIKKIKIIMKKNWWKGEEVYSNSFGPKIKTEKLKIKLEKKHMVSIERI